MLIHFPARSYTKRFDGLVTGVLQLAVTVGKNWLAAVSLPVFSK